MSERDIKVDADNTEINEILQQKTDLLKERLRKHVKEKEREMEMAFRESLEKKAHPHCPLCGRGNTKELSRRMLCTVCDIEWTEEAQNADSE